MRTQIEKPQAGDLIDGQYIGIPRYFSVTKLSEVDAFSYYAKFYALEIGQEKADRAFNNLNKVVKRLSASLAPKGYHLSIHMGDLASAPGVWYLGGTSFTIVLWITHKSKVCFEVALRVFYSDCLSFKIRNPITKINGDWQYGQWPSAWNNYKRIDHLLRRLPLEKEICEN